MPARSDVRYPADVAACLVAVNQYQIAVVHHADLAVVLVRLTHLEAVLLLRCLLRLRKALLS